jgi:hypothetical protein
MALNSFLEAVKGKQRQPGSSANDQFYLSSSDATMKSSKVMQALRNSQLMASSSAKQ